MLSSHYAQFLHRQKHETAAYHRGNVVMGCNSVGMGLCCYFVGQEDQMRSDSVRPEEIVYEERISQANGTSGMVKNIPKNTSLKALQKEMAQEGSTLGIEVELEMFGKGPFIRLRMRCE
ncbi:hypothetical protein NDU88_004867 [Pleurodeles waltl]|uniref:Uncharacterized protein n=1 Tax=Pleurodeles waltl TaxID=8319 RepID=A0AAV7TVH8_PLEWA|nr:hypothetical protein NDU88_004867 [Pleurodeles waltl]